MTDSSTTASPDGPGAFLAPTSAAPAEDAALDAILQALVVGVTGLPGNLVRPRWQLVPPMQPEANTDWCAIGVTDEDPDDTIAQTHTGRDTGGTNPSGYSTTYSWMTITVMASFYGPNARANASLLRDGLAIAQNRESLFQTGIALMERVGKATFVPEIVNQQTVRRFDLSMRFRRAIVRTWPILDLLEAQISINADSPSATQSFVTPSSTDPLEP